MVVSVRIFGFFDCKRRGFTIVELLVVIAIIGILIGMVLPAVQSVREAARRTQCKDKLRMIALASFSYESAHRHLPFSSFNAPPGSSDYQRDTSWLVSILPFVEQHQLFEGYSGETTLFAEQNRDVFDSQVNLFQCPSSRGIGELSNISNSYSGSNVSGLSAVPGDYRGCSGFLENGSEFKFSGREKLGPLSVRIEDGSKTRRLIVPDGRSQTMLAWESPGELWYAKTFGRLIEREWDEIFATGSLWTVAGTENDGPFFEATTTGTKAYFVAWAGFSTTRVSAWDKNGLASGSYIEDPETFNSVVNVTNKFGQPFSFHNTIRNVAMLDGSVKSIGENVDVAVFFDQTTLAGPNLSD